MTFLYPRFKMISGGKFKLFNANYEDATGVIKGGHRREESQLDCNNDQAYRTVLIPSRDVTHPRLSTSEFRAMHYPGSSPAGLH